MTTLDHQQVVDALPQYEVGVEIGRGAWGLVLSGRHRQLDRVVAIKQLPRAFAADQAVRGRFTSEARLLASLDHPHIVPVYDYVERDGLCLLVMELLPGGTVWSRFTEEGFTQPAAVAVVLAGAAGLHAAHGRHVLHRDVKPENLMFSATGTLKVTDFGIAKVVGGNQTLATRAGEVLGTPAYIAPEQARGALLSAATDVYALATMLYELLSGQLPFVDDGDAMALLFKHAFEAPVPLSERIPDVPSALADVVMRGLATDPTERYESAEAFAVALAKTCTAAWGPGWLLAQNVPVMGAGAIVAATTERTVPIGREPAASPAPPTVVSSPAVTTPRMLESRATRPAGNRYSSTTHTQIAALDHLHEAELVPLSQMVVSPPGPGRPLLIVGALLVAMVVLALVGGFPSTTGAALPVGNVQVVGNDLASGNVVDLDLSKPISVQVGSSAPVADTVRISFDLLGVRVLPASARLVNETGPWVATAQIDDSGARYLVAGRVTGQIDLLSHGSVVATQTFPVRTAQPGMVSAPGGVVVLLALFVVAYTEFFLRALRRGRRQVSSSIGLVVTGVFGGLVVTGLTWLVAGQEPSVLRLSISVVLGAGAGFAAAVSGIRIGRRRSGLRQRQAVAR